MEHSAEPDHQKIAAVANRVQARLVGLAASNRDERRRHEIDERDASPHECGRTLLIFKNGKAKQPRSKKIYRVCDAVREDEKSGEDVARQSRQKKVQKHRPSRFSRRCLAKAGLTGHQNRRPAPKKRDLFDRVQDLRMRTQSVNSTGRCHRNKSQRGDESNIRPVLSAVRANLVYEWLLEICCRERSAQAAASRARTSSVGLAQQKQRWSKGHQE